jgi:hypothetical protein
VPECAALLTPLRLRIMPCLAPSEFYEMQQCRKAQQQQEEEEEEELQVIVKREDRMDESDEGQERESERGGASEDDGYQEGVYSYSTGENAADSLSSPPPPAPNRSPKPANMGGVRKGKWTAEEEAYTSLVIRSFDRGLLMLQPGVTLRAYLSEKLNWYESQPCVCCAQRLGDGSARRAAPLPA